MGYYGNSHKAPGSKAPSSAVTSVAAVGSEQQPTGEELEPVPESWAIPMPTISASNHSLAASELTQPTSEVDLPEISSVNAVQGYAGGDNTYGHSNSNPMHGYGFVPVAPPVQIIPEATSVAAGML